VEVGGVRQRIVLAVLALNANRVVSVEQLVDAVWDEDKPTTARRQIQIVVSTLRKVFVRTGQPDPIRTRPPGYSLHAEIDSTRFDALLVSAREQAAAGATEQAAQTLRTALDLWRGPALTGLDSAMVRRAAILLDDHRLAALEERLRLELVLGRHRDLIGELTALVDEHPLREKPYGLLMLALYRSGRQAEALAVGRQARARLVEEAGIEPGSELRDLEARMLNRDPSLESSADPLAALDFVQGVPPVLLPASIGDFTGRDEEIARISRLLTGGGDGLAVPVVRISGQGGVGKSTLAVRVAHELADRFPDGLLYANLADAAGGVVAVLTRFLRALGVANPGPEHLPDLVDLYRSRTAGRRLLVVLDDVADEHQVVPLLPGSPTCAVIVTGRKRPGGLSGAHWVELGVLDAGQSLTLVTRMIGARRAEAEPDAAARLVRLCDGLPLALRIAGARLAFHPELRIGWLVRRLADENRRLDELAHHGIGLRSTIEVTYRGLDDKARRMCRRFAVVGGDVAGWTAAALLDTGLVEAEDVVSCLIEAQVLDAVSYPGELVPRYRMHDLIRIYAREQLVASETDADRRAMLARLAGAQLALAEYLHRAEYGGDFLVLHGSAPRWLPGDTEPGELVGTPQGWWDRERAGLLATLHSAAEAGLHEVCWDLALTVVGLFAGQGCFAEWRDIIELTDATAVQAGDLRGHAAMRYALGVVQLNQRQLTEAGSSFDTAHTTFGAVGDPHGRALVLYGRARVARALGEDPVPCLTESLALMRTAGDPVGTALVLTDLAEVRLERNAPDEAEHLLAEAAGICADDHCPRAAGRVRYTYGELYLATNRLDLARGALHAALRVMREVDDRVGEAHALHRLGVVRYREGRLDLAAAVFGQARVVAGHTCERVLEGQVCHAQADVALARGNQVLAREHLLTAARLFHESRSSLWHARTLTLLSELDTAGTSVGQVGA
jgi:DNA-binding SARP family transcriptional activator